MINERDGLLRPQSPSEECLHRSRAEFRLAMLADHHGVDRGARPGTAGKRLAFPDQKASLNGGATASFQRESDSVRLSLELLEKAAFPFASCRGLEYLMVYASPKGPLFS